MPSSKTQRVQFGKYLLLDRINVGGMAEVWRGKTRGLSGSEQLVAIKRILPSIAQDNEFVSMFIDEAKITVQLTHPNICQVLELGQINGSYFIAMEYISSKDLRSIFDHGRRLGKPAPIGLTCYVVSLICDALDHAHRKKDGQGRPMNIIHRDVSPQNILITYEGDVKVIDFGIAKAAGRASRTQAGILKGKFAYMSPEQVCQSKIDHRSDIFSIGTCFHEMLTGQRVFSGESDFAILEKIRKADVSPPSKTNPLVPPEVDKIAQRALARKRRDRYPFAREIADDLRRYLSSMKSPFGRDEMAQYMASTFAEELLTERARLREYAEIKLDARVPERSSNSFAIRRAGRIPTPGSSAQVPSAPKVTRRDRPRSPYYAALSALGAFVVGAGVALAILTGSLRRPKGFLLIDVPEEARAKARIVVDGTDLGIPSNWPVLRSHPTGPAVVTISAEGFESLTSMARVEEGDSVARVDARLRPIAPLGRLVIVTEPEASEIRINGEVVRREGDSSDTYERELPAGREYEVEVRHTGYRSFEGKAALANGVVPVRVFARLKAAH